MVVEVKNCDGLNNERHREKKNAMVEPTKWIIFHSNSSSKPPMHESLVIFHLVCEKEKVSAKEMKHHSHSHQI